METTEAGCAPEPPPLGLGGGLFYPRLIRITHTMSCSPPETEEHVWWKRNQNQKPRGQVLPNTAVWPRTVALPLSLGFCTPPSVIRRELSEGLGENDVREELLGV